MKMLYMNSTEALNVSFVPLQRLLLKLVWCLLLLGFLLYNVCFPLKITQFFSLFLSFVRIDSGYMHPHTHIATWFLLANAIFLKFIYICYINLT